VHVASIDLKGTLTGGKITIHDGEVTLRKVAVQTADGQLSLDADMDFRDSSRIQMEFAVEAQKLISISLEGSVG